ncbi:MAG: single-stranded-DNA-specific exonuclease RecJ [Candidatus Omnitrophota bacterium]|nr:MAG: single-stranded-DNA-specific exonuclease RecJ [Candidatus Omnitrophota bacterium]
MNRVWRIKASHPELRQTLARSLGISSITAQLLINRGINDEMQAHHFLYGDLRSCHDPFLLKDIDKSIARIKRAIREKENILVYGDYDVDGITGVALLNIVLTRLKANVTTYIPNRLEEGYGLNAGAVNLAHRKKISLIITVDCGISGHKEINLANKLGIDVIVTDHHEIKDKSLPKAYSIINPLQEACRYPFKHLSGVGLAYKLAQALLEGTRSCVEEHLDLVALGTVSDLSIQKGENRILTKWGLKKLNDTGKKGINALIEVSGLKGKDISSRHIGYILGPRINAMGRIGSPDVALKLLLTDDRNEASRLAGILNNENKNRRKIEARVLDEAMEKVKREINFKDSRVIVLSSPSWHAGVIGIVANRIIEKFYRPTIMIAIQGKIGKGSGRSIDNFHLFNAVNSCKSLLIDFGGHEGACGLSIEAKNIKKFTNDINKFARDEILDEDLYPRLHIDIEVELSELSEKLIEELELLSPFGPENPRPIFSSRGVELKNEPRRIAKSGFKMWVTDDNIVCEAISFRAEGMSMPYKGSKVNLVYSPSINMWQGLPSLQLDLKDMKMVV